LPEEARSIPVVEDADVAGLFHDNHEKDGQDHFGDGGIFDSDAEGILLYTCPEDHSYDSGSGFIVVSDQKTDITDFEFFDRQSWEHLGTLQVEGVSNTDGIASTQTHMPDYPWGLFVGIHDDLGVFGVGWDSILDATGLSCSNTANEEEQNNFNDAAIIEDVSDRDGGEPDQEGASQVDTFFGIPAETDANVSDSFEVDGCDCDPTGGLRMIEIESLWIILFLMAFYIQRRCLNVPRRKSH